MANKQILPPISEYRFSESSAQPDEAAIKYIAKKRGIDDKKALREIQQFCIQLKDRIISGEKIHLNSIGILKTDSSGNIVFDPETSQSYYKAVPAIRVVHKEAKHAMIVGDKETDSSAMSDILNGEPQTQARNSWKVAAIILFLIGAGILFYHFYASTSENPFGNVNKIVPKAKSDTYISH